MIARTIAQAVYQEGRPLARSDDFDEAWQSEVERIVGAFHLPPGESALDCLFAVPFARRRVAVVSVSGRRFRFLVLSRALYDVIPDPFAIVDRFAFGPELANSLPTLEWPEEPLPRRTVAQLDGIFKQGDGPLLLGACQTLVDSGRIVLKRDAPDAGFCRDLWNLLPDSIRRQTWVATFAYSTELGFGLLAMPAIPENGIVGYLTEDQVRDYPESRYERELQVAVEHNDQRTVDRLFLAAKQLGNFATRDVDRPGSRGGFASDALAANLAALLPKKQWANRMYDVSPGAAHITMQNKEGRNA